MYLYCTFLLLDWPEELLSPRKMTSSSSPELISITSLAVRFDPDILEQLIDIIYYVRIQ